MFSTDSYFHIGAAHLSGGSPCQDYALCHHVINDRAIAVVADGCSSGGMTDVGARIMAHSTKRAAQMSMNPENITLHRDEIINRNIGSMGLQDKDLLSTCAYVIADSARWICHIAGDGVVVSKYRDGSLFMTQVSWDRNTPYYPIYFGEKLEAFVEFHSSHSEFPCRYENWLVLPSGHTTHSSDVDVSISEAALKGYEVEYTDSELESLAVFTDGITQIDGMDWKDAVIEMMNFKTTTGEFLKRRMSRVIRDSQKNGRGPIDDIAGAIVRRE